jgi:diacylglycerol kinase family enzyme
MSGSGLPPESIIYFSARKRIVIDSKTPQPTQIDGDPLGTTPIVADLLPRFLPIVVSPSRKRLHIPPLEWFEHDRD